MQTNTSDLTEEQLLEFRTTLTDLEGDLAQIRTLPAQLKVLQDENTELKGGLLKLRKEVIGLVQRNVPPIRKHEVVTHDCARYLAAIGDSGEIPGAVVGDDFVFADGRDVTLDQANDFLAELEQAAFEFGVLVLENFELSGQSSNLRQVAFQVGEGGSEFEELFFGEVGGVGLHFYFGFWIWIRCRRESF